jgi:hypothetical protein
MNPMVRLLGRGGLQYEEKATLPGAQTERRGGVGPVKVRLDS